MKITIVDSSLEIINRIKELICIPGVHIEIIHSKIYSNTLHILQTIKQDVILLDANLQNGNSVELLKKIKFSFPDTSVIILSIHTDLNFKQQFTMNGADFFLDKYNDYELIPGIINKLKKHN